MPPTFTTRLTWAATAACLFAAPARADEIANPKWLRSQLEEVAAAHHLPAVAAAVVVDGKVVAASAAGHRRAGANRRVTRDDTFLLCSVSKSFTATLIARLVDQGKLRWDTTLAEAFPALAGEMKPPYRKVTLDMLLAHTSGIGYHTKPSEKELERQGRTVAARRLAFTRHILDSKPAYPPGTKHLYGTGPTVAAAAAEAATGHGYEEMLRRQVLGPLGLTTAGFGPTASPDKLDGPWEHKFHDGRYAPVEPNPSLRLRVRSPVGAGLHCSIIDLARFAAVHLDGARGRSKYLRRETFEKLFTPVAPTHNSGLGFFRHKAKGLKGDILTHNGGNGASCSVFMIAPDENVAACVLINAGNEAACKARDALCKQLLDMAAAGKFAK